jgi:hypothetical protein
MAKYLIDDEAAFDTNHVISDFASPEYKFLFGFSDHHQLFDHFKLS